MREVVPWSNYAESDVFGDIQSAMTAVEQSTGRSAVAITLSAKAASDLEGHPDILDRLSSGHGTSPLCKVTVERDGYVVAQASYRDPHDTRDVLAMLFNVATVQIAPTGTRRFAVVYNDEMAIDLLEKVA